jgi:myo-inositol 2-dehydrogenase/D-chiro-inositol 1-dehydrogenase
MPSSKVEFLVIGAGRIGSIHAGNAAAHPNAKVHSVVDVNKGAAEELAQKFGARAVSDVDAAIKDPSVNAVLICSSTDTHVDLIIKAAKAGKAIFCEKPIDLDPARVELALKEVDAAKVPFLIGFNRRFDPSFRNLQDAVRNGEVGKVEKVTIISRDPRPPPLSYVKVSGGLFRDMMIHDFDMARWLLGEEPVELYAQASNLVDPAIGQAGDIDTAMVVMRTASGALCHIQNSRRATYGYDQRLEVFGEKGMLQAGNLVESTVVKSNANGVSGSKPLDFFLQRYTDAYKAEMEHFVTAVLEKKPVQPTSQDGRKALLLAEAALESLKARKPVEVRR